MRGVAARYCNRRLATQWVQVLYLVRDGQTACQRLGRPSQPTTGTKQHTGSIITFNGLTMVTTQLCRLCHLVSATLNRLPRAHVHIQMNVPLADLTLSCWVCVCMCVSVCVPCSGYCWMLSPPPHDHRHPLLPPSLHLPLPPRPPKPA